MGMPSNGEHCNGCNNYNKCPMIMYYVNIIKEKDHALNELLRNIMDIENEMKSLKQKRSEIYERIEGKNTA